MNIISNFGGWTDYSGSGRGQSPTIRLHRGGQIDLLSPGDPHDRVSLHTADEKISVLHVLKKAQSGELKIPFREKIGDIIISHSEGGGYEIRNRRVPNTHFHFTTKSSLKFVIDVLLLISHERG